MTSKKTAFTLLIAVFIIGFAAGSVSNKYLFPERKKSHSRKDRDQHTLEKFTKELDLNENQQIHLKNLLAAVKIKYDSLRAASGPSYKSVREYFKIEFSKVLSDEQRIKYEEMNRQFAEKMKKKREKENAEKNKKD